MELCSWKVCTKYSYSEYFDFQERLICANSVPPKQQAMLNVSTSEPCNWPWPWYDVRDVNTSSSCGRWEPIHVVVVSHQTQDFPTETLINFQIWNTKQLETQESGHRNSIIYAPLVSQHIAKFAKEGSHHPPFSSWERPTKAREIINWYSASWRE